MREVMGNDHKWKVGCVKTVLGHTEAVSGLAGLINAILAIKHNRLPPTLGKNRSFRFRHFSELLG